MTYFSSLHSEKAFSPIAFIFFPISISVIELSLKASSAISVTGMLSIESGITIEVSCTLFFNPVIIISSPFFLYSKMLFNGPFLLLYRLYNKKNSEHIIIMYSELLYICLLCVHYTTPTKLCHELYKGDFRIMGRRKGAYFNIFYLIRDKYFFYIFALRKNSFFNISI